MFPHLDAALRAVARGKVWAVCELVQSKRLQRAMAPVGGGRARRAAARQAAEPLQGCVAPLGVCGPQRSPVHRVGWLGEAAQCASGVVAESVMDIGVIAA